MNKGIERFIRKSRALDSTVDTFSEILEEARLDASHSRSTATAYVGAIEQLKNLGTEQASQVGALAIAVLAELLNKPK